VLDQIEDSTFARRARTVVAGIRALGTEEYDIGWARRVEMSPEGLEELLLELYRRDIIGVSLWKLAWTLKPTGRDPNWSDVQRKCDERRSVVATLSARAKEYGRQDRTPRREWLMDYLGAAGEFAYGCDLTDKAPPPWSSYGISKEQVIESLDAESVCLALLRDIDGANYSVGTIERALAGSLGRFSNPLQGHPTYGRLSFLGLEGVHATMERLQARGIVSRAPVVTSDRTYETLRTVS
jgi:hypothetical protein